MEYHAHPIAIFGSIVCMTSIRNLLFKKLYDLEIIINMTAQRMLWTKNLHSSGGY